MIWQANAPANIALIKYMGKTSTIDNTPANASLSYTLSPLQSYVTLETQTTHNNDIWQCLPLDSHKDIVLSTVGQNKFIQHLKYIKKLYGIDENFLIKSNNNFPLATGMASSASAFAALTKCAINAMSEITNTAKPSLQEQAKISKCGSGSSCRSFFAPYAIWEQDKVDAINLPFNNLLTQSVIVSATPKMISSSKAHLLVQSSPQYQDRITKANHRLTSLIKAFEQQDWRKIYILVKEEFLEMHQLFITATPSFSYMNAQSNSIINYIEKIWQEYNDGPLITMDAGPNVHILYRADQTKLFNLIQQELQTEYAII